METVDIIGIIYGLYRNYRLYLGAVSGHAQLQAARVDWTPLSAAKGTCAGPFLSSPGIMIF